MKLDRHLFQWSRLKLLFSGARVIWLDESSFHLFITAIAMVRYLKNRKLLRPLGPDSQGMNI